MVIARANPRVVYPARFQLVAAMNPCRCGRAAEPGYACRRRRTTLHSANTRRASPGPLLDRIDLQVEVPPVTAADLILPPPPKGSAEVAARVAAARAMRQTHDTPRSGCAGVGTNAPARPPCLTRSRALERAGLALLREAADAMRLTARGYHRVLKVARTIADLDGEDGIGRIHLSEALLYRSRADIGPG